MNKAQAIPNSIIDALHENLLDLWRDGIDCGMNQGAYDAFGEMVDHHHEHYHLEEIQ